MTIEKMSRREFIAPLWQPCVTAGLPATPLFQQNPHRQSEIRTGGLGRLDGS
jgi:hypothetical protein